MPKTGKSDEFGANFYNVLEVPESASPGEIREAYLLLVRVWHPDHHQSSPKTRDKATEKIKIVNAAYKTLIDTDKRAEYDRKLKFQRAARSYDAGTREAPVSTPGPSNPKGEQHLPQLLRWFQRPWLAGALMFMVLVGLGALISVDNAPRQSRALITSEPQRESQAEKLDTQDAVLGTAGSQTRTNSLPVNRKRIGVRQNATMPMGSPSPDLADSSQKSDNTELKDSDFDSPRVVANGVPEKPDPAAHVEAQAELRRVSGDLGITSGYIATNSEELAQLRNRTDRTITEFRVSRTRKFWKVDTIDPPISSFQFVGDVGLLLKYADPKQKKFTLDVLNEGKVTEKEDRKILEPLQFYVQKSLYEIVIISIGKSEVSGYLSSPK
jgi:curved DNA-binding protein CbpA